MYWQDRGIVPWLVQEPSKQECSRARRLTAGQMNKLEGAWKADPDATLETVQEEASSQKDLLRGALRYDNAFEYQNVLAPLVQIEADYDKVRLHSQGDLHIITPHLWQAL